MQCLYTTYSEIEESHRMVFGGMPGFDQLWGNLIGEELCF